MEFTDTKSADEPEGEQMIALLHGTIYEVNENAAIIECAGVGYEALMPVTDLQGLPEAGEEVTVFTYLNVNENTGVTLFGFLTKESLAMFKLLITVSGVGPKVALAILSTLPPAELTRAVCTDDAKRIAKSPGVGGKLASKIILELKDKVFLAEAEAIAAAQTKEKEDIPEIGEAVAGLTALGYTKKDAERAAKKAAEPGMSAEQILDAAFRYL